MGPRDEAPESDRTQWYAEPRRDQRSHEKPFWEREREREYRRENGLRYDQYIPQRRHSSDRDGAEQNAPIMRRDSDHSFQTEAPRGPRRDDRMNRRRASEYFDEPKAKTSFGTNMWVSKEYAAKHQLQPNGEPLSPDVAPERLTAPAKDQAPQPSSRLIHQQSRSEPQLHLNSTSGLAAAAGTNIHATTTTAQNDGSSNIADGAATAEPMEMDLDDRAPAPAPPPLRLRTTDLSHISHTKHAFTPKSARNRGAQSTEGKSQNL